MTSPIPLVDVNVNLSRWPFRRLSCDEPVNLIKKLRAVGVKQAWIGSLDGLFHKDVRAVNVRLAQACQQAPKGLLLPFGTVNPMLPDWREDLRRCHEVHHMPGIRLHPNYHGYTLRHPAFSDLLALATQRKMIVQLAVRMEDVRMQHPLMRVADVATEPLAELVATHTGLHMVLLNALKTLRGDAIKSLAATRRVHFEISMLEGVAGISQWLEQFPVSRLLFGSHVPLFLVESAVLKLRESDLTAEQIAAITQRNAQQLLKTS